MKKMNAKKYGIPMNLQFFAEGEGGSGEGDDQSEEGEDGGAEEQEEPEKKYTEAELTEAVERRLIRERKKWQKQQESGEKEGASKEETDNEKTMLEVKVACYEAGVSKDAVDDVTALAQAYMQKDPELDLEEAIEKVVKKYPNFTKTSVQQEEKPGSWGQRQGGEGARKMSGVEAKFLELNPGLKV